MADRALKKVFDSADIEGETANGELIYQDIVDGQTELSCRFDSEKKLMFVNDSFCLFFRKKRQELFSHCFTDFIHEKDRRKSEIMIGSLTRTNPATVIKFRIKQPCGDIRWQQWSIWAVFNDRGLHVEYQAVGCDLTDLIMAERALLESENNFRQDLEKASKELVQTNTALSVLARNIDKKRDEVEKKIARTVSARILPLVEELQKDKIPESSRAKLEVLGTYLKDLTPDTAKGSEIIDTLSATELRVATMIKNNFSSKEISRLLHLSLHTVKTHRRSIRKKLNINNSKKNLASYLKLRLC